MRLMVVMSLLVNARSAYGEWTPARAILLSIYLAIGLVSVLLLVRREPKAVAALLLVQVLYKVTTPLTVGTIANPVVVSNLLMAGFHTATLMCLWRGRALGGGWTGSMTGWLDEAQTP